MSKYITKLRLLASLAYSQTLSLTSLTSGFIQPFMQLRHEIIRLVVNADELETESKSVHT